MFTTVTTIDDDTTWKPHFDTCEPNPARVSLGYHHPRVDYMLTENVTVDDKTLTIQPGTVVALKDDSKLIIGDGTNTATLSCIGSLVSQNVITIANFGFAVMQSATFVPVTRSVQKLIRACNDRDTLVATP